MQCLLYAALDLVLRYVIQSTYSARLRRVKEIISHANYFWTQ